jgi:hypothetical protein
MKLALLGVAAMAIAIAVGGSASASGASGASGAFSCKLKEFKVKGFPAVTGCGPATVELTVSGTSYSFKNGLCEVTGTGSGRTFSIELGTTVHDPKSYNDGYPFFSISIFGAKALIDAEYHGKLITGDPGPGLLPVRSEGKYAGTFSSHGKLKISGSWNCHGVSA